MLSNASAAGQPDLVTALLDRHANPNKCGAGVCPLTMCVYSKDAPAMLRLLLERGADPNLVDPAVGAVAPALAMAVLQPKNVELGEILLAKAANVDGLPGPMPPIVGAAGRADKAAVEMLLRHGADLFRPATPPPLPRNALTAAQAADAKFQVWLGQQWQDGAKRSRRFDWAAWIEQGGKQTPVGDKPITLARKPFTIVVRARPDVRVMVSASSEQGLFEDYKSEYTPGSLNPVGPIHSQASVAADVCDGAERTLYSAQPL